MEYLSRHFDLNSMLYEDAIWLSKQTVLPKKQFLDTAEKMELRQQDWDTFWKRVRLMKWREKPNIKCVIFGRSWNFTPESFEVAKELLGEPLEEISGCCGKGVYKYKTDKHIGRCKGCKKECEIIYVWKKNEIQIF